MDVPNASSAVDGKLSNVFSPFQNHIPAQVIRRHIYKTSFAET